MSETTTWKKNRKIKESIRTLESPPSKKEGFTVDKIKEKIQNIHDKRKGFTKLPTLENIYEQESKKVRFSEPLIESFKGEKSLDEQDFADKELQRELERLGFVKKSDSEKQIGDEENNDTRCNDVNKSGDFLVGEFLRKKKSEFLWEIEEVNDDNTYNIKRTTESGDIETITNVTNDQLYRGDFSNVNFMEILPNVNYAPYVFIDYIIKKIGIYSCDSIVWFYNTGENNVPLPEDKDKRIVISEIYNAIFLCLIIFMTYNWFFIWCFKTDFSHTTTTPIIADDFGNTPSSKGFKFILEYYLFPLKYFDMFFTCQEENCWSIPVFLNKYVPNHMLQWFLIFAVLVSGFSSDITLFNSIPYGKDLLQNKGSWLKDWLLGLSQGKDSSYILIALLFIGVIVGFASGSDEDDQKIPGEKNIIIKTAESWGCLLYTSPSPRDGLLSRMPSSA